MIVLMLPPQCFMMGLVWKNTNNLDLNVRERKIFNGKLSSIVFLRSMCGSFDAFD